MNLRKLLTFTGAATLAVMPVATAQNPTILQGSYVSNVFGQSNFVKNPNAQTNTANVTLTTATATRSTTTPLVATSEYNVTITSANGTAAWATRTFDAGMKNQNCEARFTYRGFQATSKAQIKQGANVVAELVLTPSATDPRIASINFPCGDLSSATTFVITDTATLSGTHEIGGIYVGLATNQANVAQAEMVGGGEWTALTRFTRPANVTQSTYTAFTTGSGNYTTGAVIGKATTAGSDTTITFPYLPAGEYQVVTNLSMMLLDQQQIGECKFSIQEIDSNTYNGQTFSGSFWTSGTIYTPSSMLVGRFNFTSGGQRRFRIVSLNNAAGAVSTCVATTDTTSNKAGIYVYRFPSSSELVVTPETQNVWAGLLGYSGSSTNSVTSSSWTKLTASTTLIRELFGKADTTASNDLSLTIKNLPVGTYEIKASGAFQVAANAAGDSTYCVFGISDLSSPTNPLGATQVSSFGDTSVTQPSYSGGAIVAIYKNTAIADKTFTLFAKRLSGAGNCNAITVQAERPISITVTPLDNNANSALYVQGPVKASGTGTAIPEGYVNEFATRSISDTLIRSQSSPTSGTIYYPWSSTLTLPAGNWMICYTAMAQVNMIASTNNVPYPRLVVQNQTDSTILIDQAQLPKFNGGDAIADQWYTGSQCAPTAITASKTFRIGVAYGVVTGSPTVSTLYLRGDLSPTKLYAIRLN